MRPFPVKGSPDPWKGSVFGVQCFYGFASLETEQGEHAATFCAWLPDDAIHAVREWLDTVKFKKTAQARSTSYAWCGIGLDIVTRPYYIPY